MHTHTSELNRLHTVWQCSQTWLSFPFFLQYKMIFVLRLIKYEISCDFRQKTKCTSSVDLKNKQSTDDKQNSFHSLYYDEMLLGYSFRRVRLKVLIRPSIIIFICDWNLQWGLFVWIYVSLWTFRSELKVLNRK